MPDDESMERRAGQAEILRRLTAFEAETRERFARIEAKLDDPTRFVSPSEVKRLDQSIGYLDRTVTDAKKDIMWAYRLIIGQAVIVAGTLILRAAGVL